MKCLTAVHILFAEKREKRPTNLKVIVPYDATKIGKFFAKTMDADINTADDYFRRTFDVVYRMGPQLASGWERFFDTCYNKVAEGDAVAEDGKNEVRRVLDYLVPVAERTPRKFISILNEIASIHNTMTKAEYITMKDIVLYVCAWPKCGLEEMLFSSDVKVDLGQEGRQVQESERPVMGSEEHQPGQKEPTQKTKCSKTIDDLILGGEFITNTIYRKSIYDDNAKLAIAAIVYQIDDSKEVLMRKLLARALNHGDSAAVEKMSGMGGFMTTFRSVISSDMPVNITNIDRLFSTLEEGLKNFSQSDLLDKLRDMKRLAPLFQHAVEKLEGQGT